MIHDLEQRPIGFPHGLTCREMVSKLFAQTQLVPQGFLIGKSLLLKIGEIAVVRFLALTLREWATYVLHEDLPQLMAMRPTTDKRLGVGETSQIAGVKIAGELKPLNEPGGRVLRI